MPPSHTVVAFAAADTDPRHARLRDAFEGDVNEQRLLEGAPCCGFLAFASPDIVEVKRVVLNVEHVLATC